MKTTVTSVFPPIHTYIHTLTLTHADAQTCRCFCFLLQEQPNRQGVITPKCTAH